MAWVPKVFYLTPLKMNILMQSKNLHQKFYLTPLKSVLIYSCLVLVQLLFIYLLMDLYFPDLFKAKMVDSFSRKL